MNEVQLSAFPDLVPEVEIRHMSRPPGSLTVTLAGDGWSLVRTKDGPQGWHLIKGVHEFSTVSTLCGLRGSKLSVDLRAVVRCATCEALSAAT